MIHDTFPYKIGSIDKSCSQRNESTTFFSFYFYCELYYLSTVKFRPLIALVCAEGGLKFRHLVWSWQSNYIPKAPKPQSITSLLYRLHTYITHNY